MPYFRSTEQHLRILQLRVSKSRSKHDQPYSAGAVQEERSGLGCFGVRRRRGAEDEEIPAADPSIRLHSYSLANVHLRDMGHMKAG